MVTINCPDCGEDFTFTPQGEVTPQTRFICPRCRRGFQLSPDALSGVLGQMTSLEGYLGAWSRGVRD